MRKLFVFGLMGLLLVGMVSAVQPKATIVLEQKVPGSWEVLDGSGYLFLKQTKLHIIEPYTYEHFVRAGKTLLLTGNLHSYETRDVAALRLRRLVPETGYTLIYYGDETHNDVWPYATCLLSFTTNRFGSYFDEGQMLETSYLDDFLSDGIAEKYWVVTSTDVDCELGRMIAWNPEDYLFEQETI